MSRQIVPRRVSGVHGRLEYDSEDETTLIASKLFDKYCTANTFAEITSTFQQICDVLELKPSDHQNFYNTIKSRLTSWKAQSLWAKLDKRAQQREYKKGNACSNTRTLIIGAGPCGLRIAIEVAFLGGKAVVVEKRDRFSRNNVLHLWPFLIHDLKALGAKKFFGKFCTGAVDHVSIRSLQCILLKVALLVGVEIHHNLSFEELVEPPEDQSNEKVGWRALVTPRDHPISEYEFDVLIGADGKRNTLKGFKRKEFRGKLAIAITANFINRNTNMEARVEEISGVAFIFNQKFFKDLNQKTGIDLENIVYYKDETHYFVMTAKKHSLLNKGVLINDLYDTAKLLSPDNVNQEALLNYAREAADVSTRQKLPHLDYAHNHYGQPDVAMFDFTSIYAAEHASRVVERHGHKLLMGLCGDSLIEPFWPTGSGCARGFLGAMDMAWAIKNWASGRFTPLEVMAHRESIYQLLSQTTPENLSKNFGLYSIDPATRYPNAPMNYFKPHQVKHQYDCGDAQYLDEIVQISEQKSLRYEWIRDSHYLQKWFMRQLEAYRNLVKVLDLTTTWRSGMALCALIHKYRPELLDVFKLDPNEVAKNNQLAFDIAEKEFGISPVMTGADMAACEVPDKLSMVSYLSAFYEYFRKESIRPAKIARTPDHIPLPKGRTPRARSPAQRLSFLSRINNRMRARKSAGADQLSSDLGLLYRSYHIWSSSEDLEDYIEEEEKENEGKETRPQLTFTYNFTRKRGHNDATQDPDNVVLQGYSKFESGTVEPASKSVKAPEVSKLHPGTRGKNKVSHLAKGLSQKFQRERPVATQVVKKPSSCKTSIIGQSGSSDMCYFCQKRVYVVERHTAEGVLFHRGCLKCEYCRTNLRIGQYSFERGVNGQANFYCIQHLGLARPVRKSRKRSYDEKELQARLAAQSSDEDLEGPSHKQEPNQEQSLDPPKTPERDGGLINPLNGAVGGALDKTPERIEYYTESEVEESEIEQTKHNLSASLLEGGQDSEESSSDELWSDEELSDTNDAPWAQIAQSYNKLSKLRKERKAAKRLAKPKEGEGSGSDTETLGSSDDWQSESETEKESEGEDSDTDRFRSVRQDDGPPAVMPCQFDSGDEDDYDPIPHRSPYHRSPRSPYGHQQHQRQQYQQQQQQQRSPLDNLRSPVDYEDKEPTPSQTAIRSNRLSFFSAVAEPVRIDPFSFLGLSPAPNIAQGEKSIEPKPEPEPEPEVEQEASTSETQEVEPDTALDQDLKEKEYEELEELEDETDSSLADSATITDGSESEEDQTGVVQKVHHPIPTISIEEVDMVDIGTEEDDEKEPDVDSIEALPTIESQIELDTRMESTSEDITQSISEIIEPVAEKDELALKKELDLVELEVEIMKKSVGDKIAELAKVADDQEPASLDEEPRPEELKIAASDEELKPSEAETVVSVEETEPSHPEIADLIEETKPTELESVPLVEETMPSERETAPVVDETILSELKTQPLVEETISSELKAADLMEEAVPSQPETATVIEETNPSQPLTSTLIDEIKPDVLETESIVEEPVPGELETPALDERVKPSEPDTAALVDLIRPDELETASMVEDTKTSEPEAVSLLKEAMPSELETPASFEAPETSLDKSFEIIEPPLVLDTESMEFMTTESADFEVVPKLSDTELPEAESVEEELGETVQSQEVPVSDSEEMKEAQNLASLSGKSSPLEVPSKEIEGKDIEGKQLEDIISSETEQAKSSIESKAFSNFQNLDSFETVSPLESESVSKESDRSIEIEYVTESKKISDGLDNVGTTSESSGAVCASKLNAALEEEVQKQADHSITFKSKTPGGDLKSYDNIDSVLGEENEGDQATDLDADKLSTTTAEDEEIPVLSKGEEDTAALAPVAAMSSVAPSDEDLVSKAMAPIASILEMDLQSEDLTPTMEQADWYENPPSEITPTAEKDFIQNGSHVIDSKNIVVDSITPERSARLDAQLPSDEKVDKTMQSKSVFPPLPAINAFPPLPVVNANLFAKLVHANEPSAHAIEPKQVNGENLNEAKDDLLTSSKSDNSLLTNKPTTKLQKQAGNSDLDIPPFKEKKVKDSENHSLVHPHVEEVKDTDSKLTRQMSAPESKVSKLLEDVPVKKTKKREPVFVKVPKIKPLVIPTGVPIAQAAAAAAKARLTGRPMNVDANKESIKAKKAKEEEVSRRLREEYRQAKEQKEKELEEMRKKREEENARKKRLKDEQIRRELEEARKKQEEEAKQLREERRKNAKPPQIEKLDSWKQEDAMKRIDSLLEGFRGQTHSQGDTLKTMARKQTEEISHLAKTLMASEFIPGRGPQEPKQHPLDSKPSVNFYPEEASSTEKPYHLDERFITTRDRNKRRRNLSNQSAKSDSSFTLSTPSGSVPSVSSVSEMGSAPTSVEISITDTGSIDLLANTSESVGENLSLDELDERDEFEDSIRVEGVKSADELESKSSELRPMSADAALTPSTAEVSKVEDSMHTAESSLSDSRTPNTSAADESQYYTPDVSGIDALDASDTSLTSKKPMNNRIANSIERKSADSLDTERSSSPISPGKGVDAKRKFFWEMPQPVRIDPKKMFHDLKTPEGENNNRSIEDHLNANKNQNGQDILSNAEKMKEWKSMDVANGKKKAGGLDLKRDWQSMDSSPNIETLSPTAGVPKTNIVNGEPETDVFYTPATTIKPQPSTSHDTRKESPRAKKRILPEKQEAARYQKESNQEKARLEARERARLLSDKDLGIAEKASKKAPKIVRSDSQPEPSKFGIKGPKLTKGKVKKPTAPQLQKVDGKHERVGSDSSSKSGGSPSHVENQRTAFSDGVSDHSESSPASSRRDLIKERTKSLDRDKSKRRHLETPKLEVAKSSEKKEKRRSFLAMLLPKRDKAKDKDRKSTGFISPKEEKKGKSPADKRSGVKLRSKLKTTKAEKEKEMNRSSTFADEFNPFFEDAYGMETKEKMKLKEKIDQVAPVPARTPPEARIAPKATVEEFDTESELGDDRISIHSFRSQLNVDEEDQGKQIKRQQKVAARRQKEQELKRLRMAQEIQRQLDEVEIKQRQVEMKGIAIERALRGEGPDAEREEAELMQEWFNSVHEKNMLVRYESELWVHARELELEDRHSRLELQLRDRMSIAETEMTPAQKEEEQRILEELLEVVEQRDSLVALLEEDRLREKEEDRDLEQMMSLKGFQLSPVSYMNRDRVPSLRTMDLSFNR